MLVRPSHGSHGVRSLKKIKYLHDCRKMAVQICKTADSLLEEFAHPVVLAPTVRHNDFAARMPDDVCAFNVQIRPE